MGLDLKRLQMCLLFFFWGWVTLSQGTKTPGPCVRIATCTVLQVAKHSMKDSNILNELAEAATKNQGSNKAIKGIKGLKVTDIQPPVITLEFLKKLGMSLGVGSQITIAGKSFIGGTMEITVASNMTTQSRLTAAKGKLNLEISRCSVELISCKTNLPSSMLPKIVNKFLNSTLGKVLPGMMCPAASKVVSGMMKEMDKMWEERKCGSLGSTRYSTSKPPEITSDHARVCFEAQITRANGEEVEMPTELPVSDNLDMPELGKENSDLIIPASFLDVFMELFKGALDQDVSSDTMQGGPVLSCDALKEKVPSMEFSDTCDKLIFKIRSPTPPKWILLEGEATISIPIIAEVVADPEGRSFYVMSMDLQCSATFQILEEKLHFSLGNCRLQNLKLESSEVGTFDPELLKSYTLDILIVTVVPALQENMKDGMPLPSLMGSSYGETIIEIHPNAVRSIVYCESK